MATEQVNLRLDRRLVERLELLAEAEDIDRATLIRRLLERGSREALTDHWMTEYNHGRVTAGYVAERTGLSIWDVLERYQPVWTEEDEELERWEAATFADRAAGRHPFQDHQHEIEHGGETVRVLADIPPRPGRALLVSPFMTPLDVNVGHHLSTVPGFHVWDVLEAAELLHATTALRPDDDFADGGHGVTTLVPLPVADGAEPARADYVAGRDELVRKIAAWQPGVVIFTLKKAAAAVMGRRDLAPGRGPELAGVPTFLLAPRNATSELAEATVGELRAIAATLPSARRP